MKVHKRFALFLLLLCVILMLLIDNMLIQTRRSELELMTSMVAQIVQERLDSARSLVELAASTEDVVHWGASKAEAFLKEVIAHDSVMWSHFLMTDLVGIEFAHTEGAQHYGKSLAERDYFLTPMIERQTIVAQPIHSVSTGRKIVAIGTPIFRNSRLRAVLVGFIHLSYVSALINKTSFTASSYQMMLSADGTISAHPDDSFVLSKNIVELLDEQDASTILSGTYGSRVCRLNGRVRFVSYAPVETHDLTVLSVLPPHEAFMNVLIINAILLAVFVAIYSVFSVRQSLRRSHNHVSDLSHQALSDSLTGLYNRRWLSELDLNDFCSRGFAVLFLDIDHFKTLNDLHNHAYGDEVLRFVAETLRGSSREGTDICVRYAGDEFLVLFRQPDTKRAQSVALRLAEQLRTYHNEAGEAEPITISGGIACGLLTENSLSETISRADNATYQAKNGGRDRIVTV